MDIAFSVMQLRSFYLFGTNSSQLNYQPVQSRSLHLMPLVVRARGNTRTENPKIRNRRMQNKYNGTATRPRLSVFCSGKQLYATLVDDQNKKCLFFGSTIQKSIRQNPPCDTIESAKRVGEELIKACNDLKIQEISKYDRKGSARSDRIKAFEIPIARFGFLTK